MGRFLRKLAGLADLREDVASWLRLRRWSWFGKLLPHRVPVEQAEDAFRLNGGLSVLVVDDNPSHLKMASEALEGCGISALLASDGEEAVLLACQRQFSIILMDLQMPVMDGLKATSMIRQFEGTSSRPRTPVVAYSTARVSAILLTANGLDDRLNKPCSAAELEACLLRWCSGFQPWAAAGATHVQP